MTIGDARDILIDFVADADEHQSILDAINILVDATFDLAKEDN